MAVTSIATLQTVWDCKWSRPGFRLLEVGEPRPLESLWVCTRLGRRQSVTDEQCENCPHWKPDDSSED